jgi:hypothetical protein
VEFIKHWLWVVGQFLKRSTVTVGFLTVFLVCSYSVSASARTITLACVDCYSSSSFYALRAAELAPPGVQVRWIFLQTHDYEPAYQGHIRSFPEGTVFKRIQGESDAELAAYLIDQKVEGVIGGMDEGTYHANAINAEIRKLKGVGFEDDAADTRHLRRSKLPMGEAAGDYGIPAHVLTHVDSAMEWIDRLPQQEIVVKYNSGAAGFKMDFLSKADPIALRARLQERLDGNTTGAFGKPDLLLIQPRLRGREFFINTYSFNGVTYLTGLSEYFRIVWGDKSLYFVNTFLALDSEEAQAMAPIAAEINLRLGKRNGPAHIEFLLEQGTGRWYLIENNVRVAGAGVPELERAVYGTSHLDLHLLRFLDPARLARELAATPRSRVQSAAMFIVPSPYAGELTGEGIGKIESLPSYFHLPFNYRMQPGPVKQTHDLYSAPFVIHMLGAPHQLRQDVERAVHMLKQSELVQFAIPQDVSCSSAIQNAGQLFHTLQSAVDDVNWFSVPKFTTIN